MHYFFSPLADWDTFCCQCVFVCLYLFVPWHSSLHGMTVLWLKQFKMLKICNVAKGQRRPSACVTHNKAVQQYCDCLLDPDVTWGRCMTSLIAKASFCEISWFFFFFQMSNICLHRTRPETDRKEIIQMKRKWQNITKLNA